MSPLRACKDCLRQIRLLDGLNSRIKGHIQTQRALQEEKTCVTRALRKGLNVLAGDSLRAALRRRLASRGVFPQPGPKGSLHIFLACYVNTWERFLPLSLERFGSVTEFRLDDGKLECSPSRWLDERRRMNRDMLNAFREAHERNPVDVVLSYLSGWSVSAETLRAMGDAGAVIVNFCWDDKLGFLGKAIRGRRTGPGAIAAAVDLHLTNAVDSRIKYRLEGGLAMFWPEAAEPSVHRPYPVPFEFDVSFVGARYGRRPAFIDRLRRAGVSVATLGRGWPSGALSDDGMVRIYSQSRINLGFSGVGHSRRICCLKGRDFEIPMSGGLYLTQHHPELELVYRVGEEIVTYRDEADCVRKIQWLLANPEKAQEIRRAGRRRALRDHTWDKRFESVFRTIGVLEKPAPVALAQLVGSS